MTNVMVTITMVARRDVLFTGVYAYLNRWQKKLTLTKKQALS